MPSNFYMYFVAALIPMIVGAAYYHPKVFGTSWMKVNGFTEESLKGGNMLVIFGVSYIFSIFLAFTVSGLVIHQSGIFSTFAPEVFESGGAVQNEFNDIMSRYGDKFRTFGHGAVHGIFATIFFALPLIGINSLFERRGWKYILIHTGYWLVTLVLMGGLLCATLQFSPLS